MFRNRASLEDRSPLGGGELSVTLRTTAWGRGAVSQPLILPRASASLRVLQVLRDEAHRFAVGYHRKLRGKRTLSSGLDKVPGIGPKRRQALLQEFGSIRRLRQAHVDEIAGVKGFSPKLAEQLKSHLEPEGAEGGGAS